MKKWEKKLNNQNQQFFLDVNIPFTSRFHLNIDNIKDNNYYCAQTKYENENLCDYTSFSPAFCLIIFIKFFDCIFCP